MRKSGLLTAGLVTACGGIWPSDNARAATATASMAVSATVVRTCVVSLQPYPRQGHAGIGVDCPADVPYSVTHGSDFVSRTTGSVRDAANSNQTGSTTVPAGPAGPGVPAAITTVTY